MTMRRTVRKVVPPALLLCLTAALLAGAAQVEDQLMAKRRLFSSVGPGLRAVRRGADGKYYVLASPNVSVAIFDAQGKSLGVIGAPSAAPVAGKEGRRAIAFAEDCDVDAQGTIYVADRGNNLVSVFSPDGKLLRSMSINGPVSLAALQEGEVAVTTLQQDHLVTVFGSNGRVAREFGEPEEISSRPEMNRYLSMGRLLSDPQGKIYYGYTYLPEPLVRQYDRYGYTGQNFEFTGLDAFPEGQAARKEIERQEKRVGTPSFHQILTAFGVDPVNGDVWMALHNTLVHFDKDGNRRSEYQIYSRDGARLEAVTILVEDERLLIGGDPLGVYEFQRPDRKH
jgi:hypothetical protein